LATQTRRAIRLDERVHSAGRARMSLIEHAAVDEVESACRPRRSDVAVERELARIVDRGRHAAA
jgi:hypothetical protein